MKKSQAVESLGQHRLMLPAWVKAALSANDRLKVYLTVLQTAAAHAAHPKRDLPDLTKEIAAANPGAHLADMGLRALKIDTDEKHPRSNYFPMPAPNSPSRNCLAFWATWYPIRLRSTCPTGSNQWAW